MSSTTVMDRTDAANPFDETLHVDARFAGGTITVEPEHVEWLGETLVQLDIPGLTSALSLRTYEARDLAHALLNMAAHIDETQPHELRRITEPGQPDLDDMQLGAGDDRIGGIR